MLIHEKALGEFQVVWFSYFFLSRGTRKLTISFTETASLRFKPLAEPVEDYNNPQGLTWGDRNQNLFPEKLLAK